MAKITFIGAGSLGFTRGLVRDLLTFPLLEDSTICLVDIDEERLDFARRAVETIIERGQYPAKVETSLDRTEVLKDSDAVVITILAGGVNIWKHDIEVPMKYGVDINVGDTRGVSGIFRALRTIPVMLDICRDVEKLCPNAIVLNYTNPMAMLCRAIQRETHVKITGLCHSVQGTAGMLANWIGASMDEITYVCAGINHMAWYLEFNRNGQDAYPEIRKAVRKKKIYEAEPVRNEMFLAFDYYVTESSGHNSEYNWWFRKRKDLVEKYCLYGTNWNAGRHAMILEEYKRREKHWKKDIETWFEQGAEMSLERGHEYASNIINAYMGGEPYQFNGNVPNKGLIPNLPQDACVEVPVLATKRGFDCIHAGELPPQCAALNRLTVDTEEMAVEAALTGDAKLVYQAICYDPLPAAVLSLQEIKKMVKELFRKNKDHLPQFESFEI